MLFLLCLRRFDWPRLARDARMELGDAQARRGIRPGSFRVDYVRREFYDISKTIWRRTEVS